MNILDIAYLDPSRFGEKNIEFTRKSPYSLVVPRDLDAVDAVRIAELNKIGVICVVDSLKAPQVEGIVAVNWVSNQIRRVKRTQFSLLSDELERMAYDPAEIAKNYHHEWLNFERPGLVWCDVHKHLAEVPCPYL